MASNYPRPPGDTGAGVHLSAGFAHPMGENEGQFQAICNQFQERGLTWAKLGDMGGSSLKPVPVLLGNGIMPVVRMFRERPYPGTLEPKQKETVQALIEYGVRYFERGNEPNLIVEWKTWPYHWPTAFEQMARDWYEDAKFIADLGGYVAIDAMSPGGNWRNNELVWGNGDDIGFLGIFLEKLREIDGAIELLAGRGWVAVHPAMLNHPLSYPDDPINQKEHPGQTVHTYYYDNGIPTGASNCWRKWEAVHQVVLDTLGLDLPVLGTEGGAWPGNHADSRYPSLTNETASLLNYESLASMRTSPYYFLAHMPWLLFNRLAGNLHEGFERDSWLRIPGYGNCPENDPAELPIWSMLQDNKLQPRAENWGQDQAVIIPKPEPTPVQPESAIEAIRKAAWNLMGVDYNPDAALYKYARYHDLGPPLGQEGRVRVNGVYYAIQPFRDAIVYTEEGKWSFTDIKEIRY